MTSDVFLMTLALVSRLLPGVGVTAAGRGRSGKVGQELLYGTGQLSSLMVTCRSGLLEVTKVAMLGSR